MLTQSFAGWGPVSGSMFQGPLQADKINAPRVMTIGSFVIWLFMEFLLWESIADKPVAFGFRLVLI